VIQWEILVTLDWEEHSSVPYFQGGKCWKWSNEYNVGMWTKILCTLILDGLDYLLPFNPISSGIHTTSYLCYLFNDLISEYVHCTDLTQTQYMKFSTLMLSSYSYDYETIFHANVITGVVLKVYLTLTFVGIAIIIFFLLIFNLFTNFNLFIHSFISIRWFPFPYCLLGCHESVEHWVN